ncbi:MAG TPA: A24 family peptidase [Anaerolineaceae bacterium]|nr:A24 family peptidase [Anaerolineaceae bacterium]
MKPELIGIVGMGWLAGLLVNYLADVLPWTRRFSQPVCQNCSMKFPWGAYLFGKACPNCHSTRNIRFWIVQISAVIILSALWLFPPASLEFWAGSILLIYFGIVAVIDIEHRLVLHPVSLAGLLIGLAFGIWRHGIVYTLLGGAAGFGLMLGLYYLGDLFARWLAKRRGQELTEVALGFGDVNLAGIIGLILGWPGVFAGLWLAIVFGGIASLGYVLIQLIAKKYQMFTAIPYAPFLLLGAILLLFRF